jgi:hypothetical protein
MVRYAVANTPYFSTFALYLIHIPKWLSVFIWKSLKTLEMFRFAMANATLRERYTQHNKTGSFILWLTLIKLCHHVMKELKFC